MTAAIERRAQPERQNFIGQSEADNARAHRQNVSVVVLTRHAGRVEIVAERGAHARDLVGRNLFALTAAAEHDAPIGDARADSARDIEANGRVIDGRVAVCAAVVYLVTETGERFLKV